MEQNDMDFEQMMGELAAMKTDLANRQANRFGSRPSTPRDADQQEPRRTRLTRAKTETRADTLLSVETATLDQTVSPNPSVLSPVSPVIKRTATAGASLRDPDSRLNPRHHRPTLDRTGTTAESDRNEQPPPPAPPAPRMRIDAAIPEQSAPSELEAAEPTSNTNGNVESLGPLPGGLVRRESKRAMPVPLPPKSAQRSRSISHGSSRLTETLVGENDERVSNGLDSSPATPQETSTAIFDGPVPPRKFLRPYPSSPSLSTAASNGQIMPSSPRVPARSNSRSYAKSPRAVPGSPSFPDPSTAQGPSSPFDHQQHPHQQQQYQQQHPHQQQQQQQYQQYQYHHQQAPQSPMVPPRSRSASRSLSRSNTLTKSETKHDEFPFTATPSIAEDRETPLSPQEPPVQQTVLAQPQQHQEQSQQHEEQYQQQQEQSQQQQEQPQQQQEQPQQQQEQPQQQQEQEQEPIQPQPQQQQQQEPIEPQQPQPQPQPQPELQPVEPQQQQQDGEDKQQQIMVTSEEALQRGVANSHDGVGYIQKKSSNNSLGHGNEDNATQHPLAPSLLPAHSIPSRQTSAQGDNDGHDGRPTLRKQQSVDPAAMYRQHQQEAPMRDRLPSRHASERRPNRDRNPSGLTDAGESGRSREPSGAGGAHNESERGRKEGSFKGGMFAWVRSRSKSRDASHAKHTIDTSHPVPESTYPEYNPALIPSRGGSQRSKSLPRKASNQNFQADSGGWPPVPQAGLNGDSAASLHQRSKSTSKFNRNPPPFANSTGGPSDTSGAPPSLNISTNKHTMHHENMIRGMGMGSTPMTPAVLLTPQPSFPTTQSPLAAGGMRGMALAMMKDDNSPSSSEQQMQQRHVQLQQAQMQHLQQQQQRLAASVAGGNGSPPDSPAAGYQSSSAQQAPMSPTGATAGANSGVTAGANSGAANQATQRLVATRIYIQTEIDFKSVNLAPNSTALDALHMLQERGCFGQPGDGRYHDRWTIFEYSKEFLIERPLRDFEVILDVMKTWEADKDNKMICKSFPARNELTAQEVVRLVGPAGQEGFVRPHGWVHLEIKKSKWVKRYLHITDTAVYHSKDAKFNGESMLCLLRNFDVYAVQVPRKKAPTKFGFALKSSDKVHLFETPEDDYIHYVCTDSGELLREWLAGLRAAKGMFMYHANPEMIREGQKQAAQLLSSSSASQDGLTRGNLTEEQLIDGATPTTDSKSAQDAFSPLFTLDPLLSAASSPLQSSVASQDLHAQPQHNTPAAASSFVPLSPATSPLKDTFQLAPPSQPFISLAQSLSSSSLLSSTSDNSNISSNNAQTTASTISQPDFSSGPDLSLSNPTDMLHANSSGLKNPFMAGSLLQQRVEAEKQEIESMKMQLKMREQAGVLGSRHMDSNNSNNDTALLSPGLLTAHYQQGGHGRGLSSTSSSTSISSSATTPAYPYQQQQKQQQTLLSQFSQPKFGGPGTLIEQGEVRAAQLSRSKSAGTGLLRPSNGVTSTISNTSSNGHRTRSRSRGPAEDRAAYGSRPISPSSPRSPDFAPPMPQGPLLQFADADAMIQPGLLLNRARSNKQQLQPSYSSNQLRPSASSRRPGAGQSHGSQGQSQSAGTRGRVKPLIDISTGPDVIGPGLLTNGHNNYTTTSSSSHAHNIGSSRSPRRTKPLLEF